MMYTIALLATVVVSMSIEHPLVSETVLAKEFRPISSGPFVQDAQIPNTEWFNQIPLKGKGPNGCDFSDMEIASLYHLRLVEAHPKYIACQGGLVKTEAGTQISGNMKRDLKAGEAMSPLEEEFLEADDSELVVPDINQEATLTAVAELTKELETLKAGLPAASGGKIESLELYEPIKRQFERLYLKLRHLDIRYDQAAVLNEGIEEFSQTISDYNYMANNMCGSIRAFICVHFNQRRFYNALLYIQRKYLMLENEVKLNEDRTEDLLQSYKSRLDALRAGFSVILDVDTNQWVAFHTYFDTVLGEISHTQYQIEQMLQFGESHL